MNRKSLGSYLCVLTLLLFSTPVFAGNFQDPLEDSITIEGTANDAIDLENRFQDWAIDIWWGEELRDFIVWITVKIIIPVFIFAWIILAIIWFYKLMGTDSDEEQKIWFNYLLRGTLGIVLMVSAGFITNQLIGTTWDTGILWSIWAIWNDADISGAGIAEELYLNIIFPLMRVFIYFIMGILFMMVVVHAFKYIFSKDDEFQRKSFTILIYNAIGILVIILAKSLIEIVYGRYEDVINTEVTSGSATNAGQIGSGVLEINDFSGLQLAINYVLSIATFIVLVLIVYQSYQLLVNPSDEELVGNLSKNIAYTFIGILIIGAGYLITNFFIIT